jgi:tRNA threonylcarbamoyladenosine biosynthesis protein TsaB
MILSLETATEVCGVALVDNGSVVAQRVIMERNIHSERLMPMVSEVLHEGDAKPENIRAVAISIGPGSFTGLRIGLSAAKGLACAWEKPLIPVSTLDSFAEDFVLGGTLPLPVVFCAVIDARREDLYYAVFEISEGNIVRISPPSIRSVSSIVQELQQYTEVVVGGEGIKKIKSHAGNGNHISFADNVRANPVAVAMCAERGGGRMNREEFSMLEPLYLRDFNVVSGKNVREEAASGMVADEMVN